MSGSQSTRVSQHIKDMNDAINAIENFLQERKDMTSQTKKEFKDAYDALLKKEKVDKLREDHSTLGEIDMEKEKRREFNKVWTGLRQKMSEVMHFHVKKFENSKPILGGRRKKMTRKSKARKTKKQTRKH